MLGLECVEHSANTYVESTPRLEDSVWRAMWRHLNCYLLPVDDYTRWFLMDEVSLLKLKGASPIECVTLAFLLLSKSKEF